ncbi:MAG: DUF917 domain-containing protein [Gammaproteobacteria bacterium]
MKIDNVEMIKDLARGAVLLGTGGGGDPYIGQLLLQQEVSEGRFVNVIKADELDDDALVVSIAGIGAPTVLVEHLQAKDVCRSLLEKMEKHLGRKVDAIIPAEVGGLNSIIPLALGAQAGLPVIDADGMGRAFPHIEMVTFSVYGSRACPMVLENELGDSIIIDHATSDRKVEDIARVVTGTLGAMVYSMLYPMSGADVKTKAILGSMSSCLEIGRGIRQSRTEFDDPFEGLMNILHRPEKGRHARILFDGKIVDISRETRDGWHFATIVMRGLDNPDDEFLIETQNEYLTARKNGEIVCIVPDLIATLDRESAEPVTGEKLKYGQRLKIIGLSAPSIMRRPECLEVFGPAAFGIRDPFVPLEELE